LSHNLSEFFTLLLRSLNSLHYIYSKQFLFQIQKIGVFSCGTPAMTQAVDTACKAINLTETNDMLFQHYYKSF